MKVILFFCLFFFAIASSYGQANGGVIFSYEQFMERVKLHHPLAMQAALQPKKGDAKLLEAKGSFDPVAFGEIDQKYFDDKQYYSLVNGGLMIPTWVGLQVKAGFEQNQGLYLNPENNTVFGLWYAGITMPLGQGLFIDARRAAFRQAQIYKNVTEAERKLMLNELYYDAANAYWSWFLKYNQLLVYQEALALSSQRFIAIQQSALLGDRPAMDTLEASIQVQSRMLSVLEAELQFQNAGMQLSVFLWVDGLIPLELEPATMPGIYRDDLGLEDELISLLQLEDRINRHPKIQLYSYSLAQLEIDRKLRTDRLKPSLNVTYNPISEAVNGNPFTAYSINNFKWGAAFSMPLFLRKERGMLAMTNVYIQETNYKQSEVRLQLLNAAKAYWNDWTLTGNQIRLYAKTVQDLETLFNAEQTLLQAGESSLFLVNSRETTFINAQMTLIDLVAKRKKAAVGVVYATAGFEE